MVVHSRPMARSRVRLRPGSVAAALLCASLAGAASAEEGRETRAEALFREGTQKLDAGDVDLACEALGESLRLDGQLGTLLNLALCHEKQGKVATAWREYVNGAAWAAAVGRTDRRDFANQHAVDLERSMSRLLLVLTAVPHPYVEIDGQPLPTWQYSLPIFLDPGAHTVTVQSPWKQPYRSYAIVPAPSQGRQPGPVAQAIVVPTLADAPEPKVAPSAAPTARTNVWWGGRRAAGAAIAAAGVVGLGIGTYFGIHSVVTLGDIDAHCQGHTCDATGLNLHDQAKTSETVSLVALGAGAVALAVGGWMWFAPRLKLAPTLLVEPTVSARSGGMAVVGTF